MPAAQATLFDDGTADHVPGLLEAGDVHQSTSAVILVGAGSIPVLELQHCNTSAGHMQDGIGITGMLLQFLDSLHRRKDY